MKKIDWDRVWRDFDKWYERKGDLSFERDSWDRQRDTIQSLVEAQLKPKRKK